MFIEAGIKTDLTLSEMFLMQVYWDYSSIYHLAIYVCKLMRSVYIYISFIYISQIFSQFFLLSG